MDARDKSIVTQVAAKIAADLVPFANPTAGSPAEVVATFEELLAGVTPVLFGQITNGGASAASSFTAADYNRPAPTPRRGDAASNVVNAEQAFGAKTTGFVVVDGDGNEVTDYDSWLSSNPKAKGATLIKDERANVGSTNKPHYRVVEPKLEKDGIWPPKARN